MTKLFRLAQVRRLACLRWHLYGAIQETDMQVTAILTPIEAGGYIAFNPETGTTTQGDTLESALDNLREAVELYLEEMPLVQTGATFVTTLAVREHA